MDRLSYSCPWMFDHILCPLEKKGMILDEHLAIIWLDEFIYILEGFSKDKVGLFRIEGEALTTFYASALFSCVSDEALEERVVRLEEILSIRKRFLQQPMSRLINWNEWDGSLKTAFWVWGFIKWVKYHSDDNDSKISRVSKLENDAFKLASLKNIDDWQYEDNDPTKFSILLKSPNEVFGKKSE